jgi:hypothetical protein
VKGMYLLIKKHKGKRKYYYTLHLMMDNEYFRLFGKFSSLSKAMKRARQLSKKYGCEVEVR